MVHLSLCVEAGHVDFGTKAKAGHQFVSIVIKYNRTGFIECLLVLASPGVGDIVERTVLSLDAIAGSEVNTGHHRHLHTTAQVVHEVILDSLLEVLKRKHSLLRRPLHQGETGAALVQSGKVKA